MAAAPFLGVASPLMVVSYQVISPIKRTFTQLQCA